MARKMKKFSAGGAQGRYDRRMADIDKDFAKDSKGKSGKALEVLEAKRAQRTADAKDDLAKRTGGDRSATRAAERLAESNLTKTRKYGAPKAVSKFEPVASEKITETLSLPKMDASIGKKPAAKTPAKTPVKTPVKVDNKPSAADLARAKAALGASTLRSDQGFSRKSKVLGASKGAKADTKSGTSAALLAPKGSSSRSGSLFGTIFKTSDAFKKAQEAKYGKAKGGSVKKEKTMKYAKGGSTSSKPPQPTAADRKADAKFRKSVKDLKVTPENAAAIGRGNRSTGMAKGGKIAPKFGAAMKKKSADTKGRAMVKKAGGGKCYASGGLVAGHKSADGIAVRGKTKTSMTKMKKGGYC